MHNNVNNIALFTDFQNNLLNIDHESCFKLFLENPNILHLETIEEYEEKGISIKEDELKYPIQATISVSTLNYIKNDLYIPVAFASPNEKIQIANGSIPTDIVNNKVDVLLYDITQTDCSPEQFNQLIKTRSDYLTDNEIYDSFAALAMRCGIQVNTMEFSELDITGYYDAENNSIVINDMLSVSQKLDCIIELYANALVENTSTKNPELKEIDANLLSVSLKQYYEMPHRYDLQRLERNIGKVISDIDMESLYSRNHKMMCMVSENINQGQPMMHQPIKHSEQEISNSFLNQL